nr:unnamed protein product [Callosobruchus analis]
MGAVEKSLVYLLRGFWHR